jgi:hypothetical protein
MPKILITGNGFDLNHNLPTNYKDFIQIIVKLSQINDYTFDNVYQKAQLFESMLKTFDTEKITFDTKKTEEIKTIAGSNIWFNYFKTELELETWIDFETKIEEVLNIIYKTILDKNNNDDGKLKEKVRTPAPSKYYNTNTTDVLRKFKLIDGQYSFFNHYHIKNDKNYSLNVEKISNYLYTSLLEFKKLFNLYFETFVTPLYTAFKNPIDKNLYNLIDYHFTFNYTPTFSILYNKEITTYHLHGKIANENKLVLGINELPHEMMETKEKKHFIPFTKYFQKLNYGTDFHFLNKIINNNDDTIMFIFFGHSLDISDADYINDVFDHDYTLKKAGKDVKINRKIHIIIRDEKSKFNLLRNLITIRGQKDIISKIKENILEFKTIDSLNDILSFKIKKVSNTVHGYSNGS